MTPQDPFEAFRRSSHEERDIPYEPGDWDTLQQRLDADSAPARRPSPWWMLLLLLPLAGLFYVQHRNMQQQQALNERLLTEVRTLQETLKQAAPPVTASSAPTVDTVYVERLVYRDRVVYRPAASPMVLWPQPFLPDRFSPRAFGLTGAAYRGFLSAAPTRSPSLNSAPADRRKTEVEPANPKDYTIINPLPFAGIARLAFSSALPEPGAIRVGPPVKRRIVRGPLIDGWDLDFAAGPNTGQEDGEPALLGEVRLGARLGKGWSVFVGAAGASAKFEFEAFDASIGLPAVPTPSEEFSFSHASLQRQTAYGQVGISWQLPTRRRWAPFADVGYLRGISSELQTEYIYENDLGQDIVVEQADRFDLPASLLKFGAGVYYEPKFSSWRLGLGGRYQTPLNRDRLNPNRLGFDLRLGYSF